MNDKLADSTRFFEHAFDTRNPGVRKFVRIECNLHIGFSTEGSDRAAIQSRNPPVARQDAVAVEAVQYSLGDLSFSGCRLYGTTRLKEGSLVNIHLRWSDKGAAVVSGEVIRCSAFPREKVARLHVAQAVACPGCDARPFVIKSQGKFYVTNSLWPSSDGVPNEPVPSSGLHCPSCQSGLPLWHADEYFEYGVFFRHVDRLSRQAIYNFLMATLRFTSLRSGLLVRQSIRMNASMTERVDMACYVEDRRSIHKATVRCLGLLGALLDTDVDLGVGDAVLVTVDFPLLQQGFRIPARVRRKESMELYTTRFGYGMEFLAPSQQVRDTLTEYFDARVKLDYQESLYASDGQLLLVSGTFANKRMGRALWGAVLLTLLGAALALLYGPL